MTAAKSQPPVEGLRPFRFAWRMGVFRGRTWLQTWWGWALFFVAPLLTGWLLKLTFDALERSEPVGRLLVLVGLAEAFRWVIFAVAIWLVIRWWMGAITLMRTNMLHAQTVSGGPKRAELPDSPAEAISRFRDDCRDVVLWADSWLDGSHNILFGVAAIAIMATVDVGAALVAVVPVAVVALIVRYLTPRLYAARLADREATSRITSFLGETFAGMLAFRLAGREEAAIGRLERLTAARRKTAVRDVVLEQTIDGISSTTADVTIGLALLMLAPRMQRGEISVGDLALFVTYATTLGDTPRFLARLISAREQALVSIRRLGELVPPGRIDDIVEHRPIAIERSDGPVHRDADPERVPLDQLDVRGLVATYDGGDVGVSGVDLSISRGEFVVITGPVGAGKSTLLRALVGLVPVQQGEIRWNGQVIEDLGEWFVPPQAAHLPQVPRLFSEGLAENIRLGRDEDFIDPARLDEVIALTALDRDLAEMPDGLTTRVGARGLRLSGGQAQRVATARSLFTSPELLVVDDLSSALDVETERHLWGHLRGGDTTIIAVSHRQFVLDQADQVITLSSP